MTQKVKILFLLVLLILLYGVCSSAKSEPPPPSPLNTIAKPRFYAEKNDQKTEDYKQATKNIPPIIEVSKAPVIQVEVTDKTEKKNDYSSSEWWLVYVTLLLSTVTFGLALYTAKLYRATVGLGKEAEKTSQRQAREMKESLAIANAATQAAISGNELNRKTFISSQRPWVVIDKIIPSSALDLKSGLSFTFVVKNVGNSPGMNVDVSAVMHLPHRGDAHQVHRQLRESQVNERGKRSAIENISFGHLLVPKEEMRITVRATNDPVEYQTAAAMHPFGEIIILLLGQVCYRFGIDESWHESGFMFSVRRRGGINVTLDYMVVPIEEVEIERFPAGFYAT